MSGVAGSFAQGVLLTMGLLSGCKSTQAPKVECDKHLQPINTPAPKVTDEGSRKPGAVGPSSDSPHE